MPNPILDHITLDSGNTYDFADSYARQELATIKKWDTVMSVDAATTPYGVEWDDGGTTITGTLVASASTEQKIYFVPNDSSETDNVYDEYITLKPTSSTYAWEKIATTTIDLSILGDLAYKDTATGSVTVPATYSTTFTGKAGTVSVTGTTAGSVSETKSNVAVSDAGSGTATYTPAGTNAASSVSASGNFTPAGTVSAPTISVSSAGSTATIEGIDSVGSMPTFTVSGTTLVITAGTVPTKATAVTVKTGDATYEASAPTFTGTQDTVSVSGTAAAQTFTGTGARLVTDSEVLTAASFTGSSMTSTGSFTPEADSISTVTATTESKTVTVS